MSIASSLSLPVGQQTTLPFNDINVMAIKVTNKSYYDILFSGFGVNGQDWIAAGTESMLYGDRFNSGKLSMTALNNAGVSPSPAGLVLTNIFLIGEDLPKGQWPVSVPFQSVGVTPIPAQSLSNVGLNPVNTNILAASPTGDSGIATALDNSGNAVFGDIAHPGSIHSSFNGLGAPQFTVDGVGNVNAATVITAGNAIFNAGIDTESNPITLNITTAPHSGTTGTVTVLVPIWGTGLKVVLVVFSNYTSAGTFLYTLPGTMNNGIWVSGNTGVGIITPQLSGVASTVSVITVLAAGGGTSSGQNAADKNSFGNIGAAINQILVGAAASAANTLFLIIGV